MGQVGLHGSLADDQLLRDRPVRESPRGELCDLEFPRGQWAARAGACCSGASPPLLQRGRVGDPADLAFLPAASLDADRFPAASGTALMAAQWGPPSGLVVMHWYPTLDDARPTAQITTLLVGVVPTGTAYVGKLIVDAVVRAAQTGLALDRERALMFVLIGAALVVARDARPSLPRKSDRYLLMAVFATMHVAWGAGFLFGRVNRGS